MLCLLGRLIRFLPVVVGVFVATAVGRGSDGSPADFAEDEDFSKTPRSPRTGQAFLTSFASAS
jgi:hypothetical protein